MSHLSNLLNWIIAIWRDISCICYTVLFVKDYKEHVHINKHGTHTPIILLHGSSGNQMEWFIGMEYIQRWLPNHPTYAFSVDLAFENNKQERLNAPSALFKYMAMKRLADNNNYDVLQYAKTLSKYIKFVLTKEKTKKIILIGHSMGGLVGVYWKTYLNENNIHCRVIGISSPFQGAPLLQYCPMNKVLTTTRHKQMTPNSDLLNDLQDDVLNNKLCPADEILTIGSVNDFHVPANSSKIRDITFKEYRRYGHLSIISNENMWKYIAQWLVK